MYLDESGFSPTLPTGYSWMRIGQRKYVAYQAPEGRRVNVVAAQSWIRDQLFFECRTKTEGRYDGAAHVRFMRKIKARLALMGCRPRPLWIVQDNYSVHHSRVVQEEKPLLEAAGIHFFYLPAYSPAMNDIEALWRQVKYQDLPDRSYQTEPALKAAVEKALQARADTMKQNNTDLSLAA